MEELIVASIKDYGIFGIFLLMMYRQVPKLWQYMDNREADQKAERERFIKALERINEHSERIAIDNQASLQQIASTLDTHSESLRNISSVMLNCTKGGRV